MTEDLWAERRVIDEHETPIDLESVPFNARDLNQWIADIEMRPTLTDAIGAFGTGHWGRRIPIKHESDGSIFQRVLWKPQCIKRAWEVAWPDQPSKSEAVLPSITDDQYDDKQSSYAMTMRCYKTKTGWFTNRYVIFIQASAGKHFRPLGFVAGSRMGSVLSAATCVMAGEEPPYRRWKAAIANVGR